MNRNQNQVQLLPQGPKGVVQEQQPVNNNLLYEVILSVQRDIQAVKTDCARLSEQLGEVSTFMVRAQATEEAHKLPAKIEAHEARLAGLEKRETEFRSELRGQVHALKWLVGALSLVATVLGIWLAIKQLSGK